MMRTQILRVVAAKLLIPYILLFALYVQFHGDFGPGGGFQAGVIFSAGFILFSLIFGLDAMRRVVPPQAVEVFIGIGLLTFAGTGVVTMFLGENFLDYDALSPHPTHGQHWGIFAVELGVGITVAAVMMTLFYSFANRGRAR
ncbi:MAG: Na(+)/H(+) antiporter subunit B [Planctomycetota bacterium]|jgi:multicomponent Na+:H+ antiporter subunit B